MNGSSGPHAAAPVTAAKQVASTVRQATNNPRAGVPADTPTRRAMPGWAVDRIRCGVPGDELRDHGGSKAVYGALVSTAMSAMQSGHGWPDWHAAVTSHESRLGQQARLDNRRRYIGAARYLKMLESAWHRAGTRITNSPPFTSEDIRQRARDLLEMLDRTPWTATTVATDQHVYRHALSEAERRGHTRPVLPVREIAAASGISKSAASRSLHRLADAGLLRLHRRGQRSAGTSNRAGIYVVVALTAPDGPPPYRSVPVNGPYVPPGQDLMSHLRAVPCPTRKEPIHV